MWVQRDYRAISGVDPGDCRVTVLGRSGDRRGHGNRMLNNEQQVFTPGVNLGNTKESLEKSLEMGRDSVFCCGGQPHE